MQMADRWHLMENASVTFLIAVRRAFGQETVDLAMVVNDRSWASSRHAPLPAMANQPCSTSTMGYLSI